MRSALALAAALAAAPALADPALVFSGEDWRLPIEPSDVYGFQVVTPPGGRLALAITLNGSAARSLADRTAENLGETVTLSTREGDVLLAGPLDRPILRGAFAVTFGDAEDARRMARRLQGQE